MRAYLRETGRRLMFPAIIIGTFLIAFPIALMIFKAHGVGQ